MFRFNIKNCFCFKISKYVMSQIIKKMYHLMTDYFRDITIILLWLTRFRFIILEVCKTYWLQLLKEYAFVKPIINLPCVLKWTTHELLYNSFLLKVFLDLVRIVRPWSLCRNPFCLKLSTQSASLITLLLLTTPVSSHSDTGLSLTWFHIYPLLWVFPASAIHSQSLASIGPATEVKIWWFCSCYSGFTHFYSCLLFLGHLACVLLDSVLCALRTLGLSSTRGVARSSWKDGGLPTWHVCSEMCIYYGSARTSDISSTAQVPLLPSSVQLWY